MSLDLKIEKNFKLCSEAIKKEISALILPQEDVTINFSTILLVFPTSESLI